MPELTHALANMEKRYGTKKGKSVYFGLKAKHPEWFKKSLKTAEAEGKGHVTMNYKAVKPSGKSHVVHRMLSKRHRRSA